MRMMRQPLISAAINQLMPPRCANGNANALRSSGVINNRRHIDCVIVATDECRCMAPFGSAVVPEVYMIHAMRSLSADGGGNVAGSPDGSGAPRSTTTTLSQTFLAMAW